MGKHPGVVPYKSAASTNGALLRALVVFQFELSCPSTLTSKLIDTHVHRIFQVFELKATLKHGTGLVDISWYWRSPRFQPFNCSSTDQRTLKKPDCTTTVYSNTKYLSTYSAVGG
jgi:hypothetical protein